MHCAVEVLSARAQEKSDIMKYLHVSDKGHGVKYPCTTTRGHVITWRTPLYMLLSMHPSHYSHTVFKGGLIVITLICPPQIDVSLYLIPMGRLVLGALPLNLMTNPPYPPQPGPSSGPP